jgi:hypothetical protein
MIAETVLWPCTPARPQHSFSDHEVLLPWAAGQLIGQISELNSPHVELGDRKAPRKIRETGPLRVTYQALEPWS